MDPIGCTIVQILFIILCSFFTSAEITVYNLNEKKLQKLSDENDKRAKKYLHIKDSYEDFLCSVRFGNILCLAFAGAFAVKQIYPKLASLSVDVFSAYSISESVIRTAVAFILFLVLSVIYSIFSYLIPKLLSTKNYERNSKFLFYPIITFYYLFLPAVFVIKLISHAISKIFGANPDELDDSVTEEEIRLMVDLGEESGTIEANEKEMIENVFEFNNMTASDVMTHRTDMFAFNLESTDDDIIKTITETGLSRFPVYENDIDNVIGILTTRKFLLNMRCEENKKKTKDLLYKPYFVPESVKTDVLFRDMQKKKMHMAIVLDEYGGTAGIVTMEDLIEEIVGNIYDEFDPSVEQDIIKLDNTTYKIAGSVEIEALEKTFDIKFDETEVDEIDTLGGLIFSKLPEIPEDGTCPELDIENLHVKVTKIADRRVEWTVIRKTEPKEQERE